MHPIKTEAQLFDLLSHNIKELEKIEDDPSTLNFVARRLGNIVKQMKDLRDDLQPRGNQNVTALPSPESERAPGRVQTRLKDHRGNP